MAHRLEGFPSPNWAQNTAQITAPVVKVGLERNANVVDNVRVDSMEKPAPLARKRTGATGWLRNQFPSKDEP